MLVRDQQGSMKNKPKPTEKRTHVCHIFDDVPLEAFHSGYVSKPHFARCVFRKDMTLNAVASI